MEFKVDDNEGGTEEILVLFGCVKFKLLWSLRPDLLGAGHPNHRREQADNFPGHSQPDKLATRFRTSGVISI